MADFDDRQGFTVTPAVYVDETGQEHISYDHANVEDHRHKIATNEYFNHNQERYIAEDADGNRSHYWDVGDRSALMDADTNFWNRPQQDINSITGDGRYTEDQRVTDEMTQAQYDRYKAQQIEEVEDQFSDEEPCTAEFLDWIQDEIISGEDYNYLLSWAGENLDIEICNDFDNVMEYGGQESILTAINQLIEIYKQHN